jgi:hypothetical protein
VQKKAHDHTSSANPHAAELQNCGTKQQRNKGTAELQNCGTEEQKNKGIGS